MKYLGKALALAVVATVTSGSANASNFQGTINNVTPMGSMVWIALTGAFDGAGSTCVPGTTGMTFAFDPSTAIGKAFLATALSAKVTGKLVYAMGTATCQASGNPYNGGGAELLYGIDLKG